MLMALCLSCFPPSPRLYPYLLCYVTTHGYEEYKAYCQHRLLQCYGRQARQFAPSMLEWAAARKAAPMAIEARCAVGLGGGGGVENYQPLP